MKKFWCIFIWVIGGAFLPASEMSDIVLALKDPSFEAATAVLTELETLVERGDARTVTLSKKVHRGVKRIFTLEANLGKVRKQVDERESEARQKDRNAKRWLRPNVHGDVNHKAANAAYAEARELRFDNAALETKVTKKFHAETADFEKMLGDLVFSRESEAHLVLARLLEAVVKRVPWSDKPRLKYDLPYLAFLEERLTHHEEWSLLAKRAMEIKEWETAYHLYQQVGDEPALLEAGSRLASQLAVEGFPGAAVNFWERTGRSDEAAKIRQQFPILPSKSYRVLTQSKLDRNVAPACARVDFLEGFQSGFFFRAGGYLLTRAKDIAEAHKKGGLLHVILFDGRRLEAELLEISEKEDLAVLKVNLENHDLLPFAQINEVRAGVELSLYGMVKKDHISPAPSPGVILHPDQRNGQKIVMGLSLNGTRGQTGGPLVDSRGRVFGVFLDSKLGSGRAVNLEGLRQFLARNQSAKQSDSASSAKDDLKAVQ